MRSHAFIISVSADGCSTFIRHEGFASKLLLQRGQPFLYDKEAFGIRFKEFHGLEKAGWLLKKLIPGLWHESDGLILQPVHRYHVSPGFYLSPELCNLLLHFLAGPSCCWPPP